MSTRSRWLTVASLAALAIGGLAFWAVTANSQDHDRAGRGGRSGLPPLPRASHSNTQVSAAIPDAAASTAAPNPVAGLPTAAPDEYLVINDEQRRYQVRLLARQWSIVSDPAQMRVVHPDAALVWRGPDGCTGALLLTQRVVANYKELEPLARDRLAELPVKSPHTLWFEATRYNDRPGYRFTARGTSREEPAKTLRFQYSVVERDGWVFEVLATSDKAFTTARWCHDRVTASASF